MPMEREKKLAMRRARRVELNAQGLTERGTPIKDRVKSHSPDAIARRARRAALREQGLNSRGKPMLRPRHAEVMAGTAEPGGSRDQRSWWLVTTECPKPVATLLEATGGWALQRSWEGGRLRPYRDEPSLGDSHEAA